MEIKLIICFSCVILTINFQRLKTLLVTLLFFIVEYMFLKQFVKSLMVKYTYLLTYLGVMSHDTEDWCKIWRKTNLLFQNWQELGEFWSEHSKVSKICTLVGPFRAKYIIFDLKCTEELSFMTMKSHVKFEEKIACGFKNDIICILMSCFWPKYKIFGLRN